MSPEEIIQDAEIIYAIINKLSQDFAHEHDHANAVFDEILGRYVPPLQKALRQISGKCSDGSNVVTVRVQESEK